MIVGCFAITWPLASSTTTTAGVPSNSSSATRRLAAPLASSTRAWLTEEPALFTFVRRSTDRLGRAASTRTRQRKPAQLTSAISAVALAAALPAVTRMTGTRLSWRLNPPWAYSLPALKARDARRHRDALVRVPMPAHGRYLHLGAALDRGATRPPTCRQVLGEIDLGEPSGQPEPTVVRHHTDLSPTGLEQYLDTLEEELDLLFDSAGEFALQRMPQLVELAVLGPAATSRIARFIRTEVLVAA